MQSTGEETLSVFSGSVYWELGTGTELERAISWMYVNGLTMYDAASTYRPNDSLTREEAAKLMGQLFEVLAFEKSDKGFNCAFADSAKFDPTLAVHIQRVCTRGIFKGNDKTQEYMPHDSLTKGQILAVLMRILEGKMSDETLQPRWIEYYVKAKLLGLTSETVLANVERSVTRGEVALLIYRFKNLIVTSEGEQTSSSLEVRLAEVKSRFQGTSYEASIDEMWRQRFTLYGSGSASGT